MDRLPAGASEPHIRSLDVDDMPIVTVTLASAILGADVASAGRRLDMIGIRENDIDAARAKKCDLIFMASHGRTGLPGIVLGSQASKVLSHSSIPVLVHKSGKKR